jgi:hypothetical protein
MRRVTRSDPGSLLTVDSSNKYGTIFYDKALATTRYSKMVFLNPQQ